eukprot:SAG11_NODE_6408_length_1318_cov_4.878689_2_plen_164_part_01
MKRYLPFQLRHEALPSVSTATKKKRYLPFQLQRGEKNQFTVRRPDCCRCARVARRSPAAVLPADITQLVLAELVCDPIFVPGTKFGGAHTGMRPTAVASALLPHPCLSGGPPRALRRRQPPVLSVRRRLAPAAECLLARCRLRCGGRAAGAPRPAAPATAGGPS